MLDSGQCAADDGGTDSGNEPCKANVGKRQGVKERDSAGEERIADRNHDADDSGDAGNPWPDKRQFVAGVVSQPHDHKRDGDRVKGA